MSKSQIYVIIKVSPDGRGGADYVNIEAFSLESDAEERVVDLRCLISYHDGDFHYEIDQLDFTGNI